MIAIVLYALGSVVLFALTWFFYVSLTHIKHVMQVEKLHWSVLAMGYPFYFIGLVLDMALNVCVFSVVGLELPREFLVTSRLRRWRQVETKRV